MPNNISDYKELLSEVIKKQIIVLGPNIALIKARNVKDLLVANDGSVIEINGDPQRVIQELVDQFVQLSGLIVKKTMEPLLLITKLPNSPQKPIIVPPVISMPTPPTPTSQQQQPIPTGSLANGGQNGN